MYKAKGLKEMSGPKLITVTLLSMIVRIFYQAVSQKLLDEIQLANQMQNAENRAWDSDSLSMNPSLAGNTDIDGK